MKHLKSVWIWFIGCLIWVSVGVTAPSPLSALEIVKRSDELSRGKSSYAELMIKTVRPSWERKMKMKNWTLGTDYTLVYILSPAKEKGTVFLKRKKEMWNWIPRIDRSIKLPPSMMMQSWMGTDFTNDDLVKQSSIVTDYTHELMGDSLIEKRSCWKIKMTPLENAPVVWGGIVIWVEKEHYLQLKVEYYDEEGELINVLLGKKIKKMGGRLLPSVLEYIPMDKEGHKTVIEYQKLKFDVSLNQSFFSSRNMKKVK